MLSQSVNVKDRLNNLERLISSLLSGQASTKAVSISTSSIAGSNDVGEQMLVNTGCPEQVSQISTTEATVHESPHLSEAGDGRVDYIDRNHWLSILDDINEVREHLSTASVSTPVPSTLSSASASSVAPGRQLRVSEPRHLSQVHGNDSFTGTLDAILRTLPTRPICDMLISSYFNSRWMVLGTCERRGRFTLILALVQIVVSRLHCGLTLIACQRNHPSRQISG
jgi:hypothetical protein